MTNYTEARTAFIATVTDELTRAFDNIKERGVSGYTLARQDDGSVEAFANGLRVNGAAFWTMGEEVHEYDDAAQYLEVLADDMRGEYNNPDQD